MAMETSKARPSITSRHARRGSVYLAVLGVAMIAAMCVLAGMHVARGRLRGAQNDSDRRRARLLATAAVEHAISLMRQNHSGAGGWRNTLFNNTESAPLEFGGGRMSFKLVDEDGILSDDSTDPVWIYGYGRAGKAVWVERAKARTDRGLPLEALNTAVHCSGTLEIQTGMTLTATGAPASTDTTLLLGGQIVGDAHAAAKSGTGTASGTLLVPAAKKGVPFPNVFDDYKARATQLAFTGDLDTIVLAPGRNEYGGGLNADGVYYIATGGTDISLSKVRLNGTLVIDAPGRTVTLDDQCFIAPFRDDFPALIVKGNLALGLKSNAKPLLQENTIHHNFNPAGAPYLGTADIDLTDSYPNEVQGVIHVIGNVSIPESGVYRGSLLVQGGVSVAASVQFIHDSELLMNPPIGYSSDPDGVLMLIQSGTWSREPSP